MDSSTTTSCQVVRSGESEWDARRYRRFEQARRSNQQRLHTERRSEMEAHTSSHAHSKMPSWGVESKRYDDRCWRLLIQSRCQHRRDIEV